MAVMNFQIKYTTNLQMKNKTFQMSNKIPQGFSHKIQLIPHTNTKFKYKSLIQIQIKRGSSPSRVTRPLGDLFTPVGLLTRWGLFTPSPIFALHAALFSRSAVVVEDADVRLTRQAIRNAPPLPATLRLTTIQASTFSLCVL